MIDIHTHIIPGADDGPKDLTTAIAMLKEAEKEGITHLISTSHICHPQFHVSKEVVEKGLEKLRSAAKKERLQIELSSGHEIRLCDDLVDRLKKGEFWTLAESQYLLLELPSQSIPNYTVGVIQGLMNHKIIPIIAHPERNKAIIEKPERLMRLVNHGALSQVTAGAVNGSFGSAIKEAALRLIDAKLVHFYGSDAHNTEKRRFYFDAGLTYLEKKGRADFVDLALENNARIIEKRDAVVLEPEMLEKKKKWFIFG